MNRADAVVATTSAVTLLSSDEARDEDLVEAVVEVINEAYAIGEAGLWIEGAKRTEPGEVTELIRRGGMLAATREGRLVGCAYVRPIDEDMADLGLVSAAPDQWGTGVGNELVRSAEELVRSRGVGTMQLELLVPEGWIHPQKARLREWYERIGYRVIGRAAFDEVVAHLAPQLAVPCEFLVFRKGLTPE